MALNRVAINNDLLNKNTFTQSVDPNLTSNSSVGSFKPTEITVDPNSIIIDRQLTNKSSIQSANLSKTVIDNSYTKQQDESPSFTSKLLNFIEPYDFGGVLKTVFYSEISTNFNVGDKVFISNGPYDSPVNTSIDKFAKGTDGYEVLAIDGCKIVLDINYVGLKPYNDIDTNDLIFLHNVTSQKEFEYINSIKTYVLNDMIAGEIITQFIGEGSADKIISHCGHFIRVGPLDNFQPNFADMTDQSIFGRLVGGALGAFGPKDGRIFYREYLTVNPFWSDCTSLFNSNSIQLYDSEANPTLAVGNKRLYTFGPDFDFNGTTFKEGVIYKFNDVSRKWEMDQSYKPAYISKLYFIEGTFTGNHRAGLFGTYNKKNVWEGKGEWQGGTVLNSVWKSGRMDSRTKVGDAVIRAKISEDGKSVIQSVDTTNNSGTGYNLLIDSTIEEGSFYQANFKNCFLGKSTGNSAMKSYFDKTDPSQFFNLYLDSSSVTFCDIQDTILSSTTIYDSVVSNSTLLGSKLSNGQIKNSVFNGGEYNADSGITILGAEINSYDRDITNNLNFLSIYGILKLFISENDYFRMSKGDSFYIEKVNKEYFLNSLSDHYKIHLPYETKYILDTYWDYEFSDDATNRPNSVSFRDKKTNKYKFFVARNEDSELTIQKIQPKVGTYWEDITTTWQGAWTPDFNSVVVGLDLCYVYVDHGSREPVNPGNSSGNETYHIFRTKLPPFGELPVVGEGPAPKDGYTTQPDFELAFINAFGPYEPTSPGQYRGEFSTDPNTIARSIKGGFNYYQENDVVEFYDPVQQQFNYYRAKLDMPTNIDNNLWSEIGFFQIAEAGEKAFISEPSKFQNYCSIDIETGLLGWYRNTKGGVTNDVWTKNKIAPNGFEQLMPIKLIDEIFKNVQIKNANFESGVFVNANWVSGSYINDYDNIISKISLDKSKLDMTQVGGDLSFPVRSYSSYNYGRIRVSDYVWIDPIRYVDPTPANSRNLSSLYTMKSITNPTTTAKTNTLLSSVGFNSSPSGRFEVNRSPYTSHASIHKVIIENSTIYGGKFKRANFKNTTFKSRVNYTKPQSNLIDPKEIPLLINIIFSGNNLTVENGVIYQSQLLDFKATGGYAYYCYANGATMSGIQFQNGYWINGTFDGGKFLDSRKNNVPNIQTNYLQNIFLDNQADLFTWWLRGSFLSGEFYNSDWVDGVFNNGKFWNSDWYGGTWSNGILGDKSISYDKTTFGNLPQQKDSTSKWFGNSASNWYDGECQSGLIGGNGRVYWYGGRMVGGEFTSTAYNSNTQSIWYDGIFDGSVFTGKAKWKNGTFNNGKFLSVIESNSVGLDNIIGINGNLVTSLIEQFNDINRWEWEDGVFNGGQFGSGLTDRMKNSGWYNGVFNGGIFLGRIWRNGVLSGGNFFGGAPDRQILSITNNTEEETFFNLYTNEFNNGGDYYGLWCDGVVIENPIEILNSEKTKSELIRATDIKKPKQNILFRSMFWYSGTFSHESATIKNSLFLNGNFVRGYFDGGVFNPYVNRLLFLPPSLDQYFSGGALGIPNIKWSGGTFVTGSFYCSVWENGTFKNGYMAGAFWKDGIWEYGRAHNVYWNGGTWKNGNWYGAPFTASSLDRNDNNRMFGRNLDIVLKTDQFISQDPYARNVISPGVTKTYVYTTNVFSASTPAIYTQKLTVLHPGSNIEQTQDRAWTASVNGKYFANIYVFEEGDAPDRTKYRFNETFKLESRNRSRWGADQNGFNYFTGNTTTIYDPVLNISTRVPVTAPFNSPPNHYHYVTLFSSTSDLSTWPKASAPYKRGLNNFSKVSSSPLSIFINVQDSAPSNNLFARWNGTTSIFTESNTLYSVELIVAVDLQKTVSVDVWMGGLSYSTFNLDSYAFEYYQPILASDKVTYETTDYRYDFLPKFYKLKFSYYTTSELLSLKDGKIMWVRKNSNGRLRVFRWKFSTQIFSYHSDYNNILWLGVNQGLKRVELPTGPEVEFEGTSRQGIPISVNFGNGYFRQGIWESGIWNNGLRANSQSEGFFKEDDMLRAETLISAVRGDIETQWFITLQIIEDIGIYVTRGYKYNTGSIISIGNLASYDSTGKRRVLNGEFEIINIDFFNRTIRVGFKSAYQISYITKDSDRHLIYLTTNVWKNGAFLNGVFRGVWNNGIIVGNPLHTVMYDTHFLDGYMEGVHFISSQYTDGQRVYPDHQTGLIQKFIFKDANIATVGRKQYRSWLDVNYTNTGRSHINKRGTVFRQRKLNQQSYGLSSYWSSPSTGGTTLNMIENVADVSGFITYDVLQSDSIFKSLGSQKLISYKLGTKKTIFSNTAPNDGNFDIPISNDSSLKVLTTADTSPFGVRPFSTFGVTFSLIRQQAKSGYVTAQTQPTAPFTFSVESNTSDINSGALSVAVVNPNQQMHNYSFILRNSLVRTAPDRYYEFSLKFIDNGYFPNGKIYMDDVTQYLYRINLDGAGGLNVGDLTPSQIFQNNYVNHAESVSLEKIEYFYNKGNMDIYFEMVPPFTQSLITETLPSTSLNPPEDFPPGPSAINIENISLYEVDMIPFFGYFTAGEIDYSVNTPYYASAPNINYSITDFKFVDDDKLKISYELLKEQNPSFDLVNPGSVFNELSNDPNQFLT